MAIREIVVHVDDTQTATQRLQCAQRVAARHAAHLVGLHVVDVPIMAGFATVDVPAEVFTMQRDECLQRAAEAKTRFDQVVAGATSSTEWRQEEGVTAHKLCVHARRADLLMAGLTPPSLASADQWRSTLGAVVLSSGVPVIAMPDEALASEPGRFVTIGWDGGREATRAVHDALPLLQAAEKVSIACIDPEPGTWSEHGELPGADLAHWLARHGVNAEAQTVIRGTQSTGEALVEWARGQGSDLLVTGGYGHTRVRELLLGGVTRHLMRHAPIAVLMSH